MKKVFLLEIECGEDTRFFCPDTDLAAALRATCEGTARVWSHGTEPRARVLLGDPYKDALMTICALDDGSNRPDDRNAVCQAIEAARDLLLLK